MATKISPTKSVAKKATTQTVSTKSSAAAAVGATRGKAAVSLKRSPLKNPNSAGVAPSRASRNKGMPATSNTALSRSRVAQVKPTSASSSVKKEVKSSPGAASGTGQKRMNTTKNSRSSTAKNRSSQAGNNFQNNLGTIKPSRKDLDIEYFRNLLLSERARLEAERDQLRNRGGEMDGAMPEEGEGEEDTADMASAMMDKEFDLSVEDEIEELLASVDHALQKMDEGTYGVCDMSAEPIPRGRLELIPWASLTVECQALSEGE